MSTPDRTPPRRASLLDWLEERFNLTEILSILTSFGIVPTEVDTRRPFRDALREAMQRPLPSYARWPRILGLVSFVLFVFLAVTGVLLAFYYQPTESEAYRAVTAIVRDVTFGGLVHQLHRWSARLLLLILFVRLVRFFAQGTYKAPREALWLVAVAAVIVALTADYTGRLLPWSTEGYWTTVRALEVVAALPVVGPLFTFFAGGPRVDSLALTRFYVFHVMVLPLLLLALFYLHFNTVRRVGLSRVAGEGPAAGAPAKVQLYNMLILTALIFGGLVTLATAAPVPYYPAADPAVTPPGVRPPWYFLAPHGLIEFVAGALPRWAGGLAVEGIVLVILLLPFIDRSPGLLPRERRLAFACGAALALLWLVLTWHGYALEAAR